MYLTPIKTTSATVIGTCQGLAVAARKAVGRGQVYYFGTNLGGSISAGDDRGIELLRAAIWPIVRPSVAGGSLQSRQPNARVALRHGSTWHPGGCSVFQNGAFGAVKVKTNLHLTGSSLIDSYVQDILQTTCACSPDRTRGRKVDCKAVPGEPQAGRKSELLTAGSPVSRRVASHAC
jgi:hypothetical protein